MERNTVLSPKHGRPVTVITREHTSDLSVIGGSMVLWGKTEDEYDLAALPDLTGRAIDIGAHIGSVTLALLADHPALRVIAVEPLAENAALLREMLDANGWTNRCEVIVAAIAKGRTAKVGWNFSGKDYIESNRYIGGLSIGLAGEHDTATVPALRMRDLVTADTVFAKLDCEGCEWEAFKDPAILTIPWVVGEGHGARWLPKVQRAFGATHDVEVTRTYDDGIGTFRAVLR